MKIVTTYPERKEAALNQKLGRKKSLSRKVIMAGEERCVYCGNPPGTLEHMPPKTMFTNVGLGQNTADSFLSILPGLNALRQGKSDSVGQFAYRFNSDEVGMFSCLASFHKGLHVMLFAMAEPEVYDIPVVIETQCVTRPGDLLAIMPSLSSQYSNIPILGTRKASGADRRLRKQAPS